MDITTLDTKHSSRSDRYKVVPTKIIASKFKELGFVVDSYQEARVRKDITRRGHQKHLVRLSHPELLSTGHSDVKLQLLVTNAHDGSSSFKMQLGFFRLVCSNGLIVGETFETIKLRHSGMILEEVDSAIERMVAQTKKLDAAITALKTKKLEESQVKLFIEEAVKLRGKKVSDVAIAPRREEDSDFTNLFQLYNAVQESLVNGGDEYTNALGRRRVMRSVNNIAKLTQLNEQLFDLAMRYAA